MGDFNELASPNEKKGGQNPPSSKFQRLNMFLAGIDAESIPVKGSIFTGKKRIHTHLIYERLDRAIARKDWATMYPDAIEEHGSFTCSDHRPIIISTKSLMHKHKAFPFRF